MNYQQINADTIDRWVAEGWEWGRSVSPEVCARVRAGAWDVVLTPHRAVPHEWFGDLSGKKLLGLASGGGQQMPVFALLGADCTVLDNSPAQLEAERRIAKREHYSINIVHADMTKTLPFADESFDLIFHPVSNCYIEDVVPLWKECYRVLKPDGVLLSGVDTAINYVVDEDEKTIVEALPFNPLQNPHQLKILQKQDAGIQFSHTLEEQIGGQLRAGFILTDLFEDTNSTGHLHDLNIPTFLAMRSVKPVRR